MDDILGPALGSRDGNIRSLIGENAIITSLVVYLKEIGIYNEI